MDWTKRSDSIKVNLLRERQPSIAARFMFGRASLAGRPFQFMGLSLHLTRTNYVSAADTNSRVVRGRFYAAPCQEIVRTDSKPLAPGTCIK